MRGVEFFVFSLCSVRERKAYPLIVKQTIRSAAEVAQIKARKETNRKRKKQPQGAQPKRKLAGRPHGVKNKDKQRLELSPELLRINQMLKALLKLLRAFVRVKYVVLDGHFGHNQAVLMAKEEGLELVSKLRSDAALFEKYTGEQNGRGARKKYGKRLEYENLPLEYLKKSESEGDVQTNYYQARVVSKSFGCQLNVVIVEKRNRKTEKVARALLFSSDAGTIVGKDTGILQSAVSD